MYQSKFDTSFFMFFNIFQKNFIYIIISIEQNEEKRIDKNIRKVKY